MWVNIIAPMILALANNSSRCVMLEDERYRESCGTGVLILSPENHRLITIPRNIWNGFKGLDQGESIIANCLTMPHNEKEMVRRDPFDKNFNYTW